MPDPTSPAFWANEHDRLWSTVAPLVMEFLINGAEGGLDLLPQGARLFMNWDTFNQAVIEWLSTYRFEQIGGINATTARQTRRIIQEWIESGDPLPVLRSRLAPIFGENRAKLISVTEVTRAYAQGNMEAWIATGFVNGKLWNTARDDRVTPLCRALDGQVARVDEPFRVPPSRIAADPDLRKMVETWGAEHSGPPAHILCRSWVTPVVSIEEVERQIRQSLFA